MSDVADSRGLVRMSGDRARASKTGLLLDRYAGRLVVQGLGAVRRKRVAPASPANIAVSVLGAIGDTLIASAIMDDLRRAFPHARITLIASASNQAIGRILPAVDEIMTVSVNRPDAAARMIRAAGFDLFIDCNSWVRISAIHAALAGCFSVGFRTDGQGRHFCYDSVVDHSRTRHELENFRALLAPLGLAATAMPRVRYDSGDADVAVAFLNGVGADRTIVLHPWAGGSNGVLKEWPLEYWITLGAALQDRGYTFVATGSPADAARTDTLVAEASKRGVRLRSAAGKLTLAQTAALLSQVPAVVAVNTGIMHLAAAVDAPLVALNGPVDPRRWGPLNHNAVNLAPVGAAGGYLYLGFEHPKDAPSCMVAISPEAALAAVLQVMEFDMRKLPNAAI